MLIQALILLGVSAIFSLPFSSAFFFCNNLLHSLTHLLTFTSWVRFGPMWFGLTLICNTCNSSSSSRHWLRCTEMGYVNKAFSSSLYPHPKLGHSARSVRDFSLENRHFVAVVCCLMEFVPAARLVSVCCGAQPILTPIGVSRSFNYHPDTCTL